MKKDMLQRLREAGETLEIPGGIAPEQMKKKLEAHRKDIAKRRSRRVRHCAAAACLFLAFGLCFGSARLAGLFSGNGAEEGAGLYSGAAEAADEALLPPPPEEQDLIELSAVTYEDIYAKLSDTWRQQEMEYQYNKLMDGGRATAEAAVEDLLSTKAAVKQEAAFGKTNIQVEQVEEADQVKNDGRYLYQIIQRDSGEIDWGIQILDTQGGLKEAAFVGGFGSLEEFYVWEDLLITIENKFTENAFWGMERKYMAVEDLHSPQWGYGVSWHEVAFYDIAEREKPRLRKKFTFQGNYETSRISDRYFYGISRFYAQPGEGEKDYPAYIPTLDGAQVPADKIYCPENARGTSYLVLLSIDLSKPDRVADSRALLFGSGVYYVSQKNIYMTEYESVYGTEAEREGRLTDRTKLLKFSYVRGNFYAQAEGELPGRLNNSFSLDEYGGYLRAVTTVQSCDAKMLTDDRTGEMIGYDFGTTTQTNALYILDSGLFSRGKIEGLAKGEEIQSARFLGETGYFVTFRQVDPLFAVDLSDPEAPKVLGELKVSGFSEYLHFYGENLLLGIGMEADEKSGRTEGMKLSMFDLSDPAELSEVSKKNLKDYNYSEALWNHRAVLIDTSENLIGFSAEGSDRGDYCWDYLVFSYEDGSFVQKFKYREAEDDRVYYRMRGTFIGDVLYLLREDGTVKAYDRGSGELLEEYRGQR